MVPTEPIVAPDGHPARKSGPWAREKLHYLNAYMEIFNGGMRYHFPRRVFIDLMAGPGLCAQQDTLEFFPGSPLLALEQDPPFERVICVERDVVLADALRARTAHDARLTVVNSDCNAPETISAVRQVVVETGGGLGLAFVDNLGLNVPFSTIRTMTRGGLRIDLLITFQVSDIQRNVGQAMQDDPAHGPRFDEFFGTRDWRGCVKAFERGERSAPDVTSALTDYYQEQLEAIGYPAVAQLHRLIRNKGNAPLYRLVLAGRHERATDFFHRISKTEFSGQRTLFD
jgi:three-Cys-motif partner protein